MRCPHCHQDNSNFLPFARALGAGRAYAQTCVRCGGVLGIRPRLQTDPPADPPELTADQIERLRFTRWRLAANDLNPTRIIIPGSEDPPRTAA